MALHGAVTRGCCTISQRAGLCRNRSNGEMGSIQTAGGAVAHLYRASVCRGTFVSAEPISFLFESSYVAKLPLTH